MNYKERNHAYYLEHKAEIKARVAKYRTQHKARIRTEKKAYYEGNKARIAEDQKARYDTTKNIKSRTSLKARFSSLRSGAKTRGYDVSITLTEYAQLVRDVCVYCGGSLPQFGHGLDRVDPTKGYHMLNVVPCCSTCNRTKHLMSVEQLLAWAALICSRSGQILNKIKAKGNG